MPVFRVGIAGEPVLPDEDLAAHAGLPNPFPLYCTLQLFLPWQYLLALPSLTLPMGLRRMAPDSDGAPCRGLRGTADRMLSARSRSQAPALQRLSQVGCDRSKQPQRSFNVHVSRM